MARPVSEVMTPDPVCLDEAQTVAEAAMAMRDHCIGDVIVTSRDRLCGVVTDRDIVVRAIAAGEDPTAMTIGEIASEQDLVTLTPDASTDEAVERMRDRAIRRIPVVADGRAIGVVSLGDLAIERDHDSVLGHISAAAGNR